MSSETATTITLATRLRRNDDIVSADVDGEAVMMSIEQGKYFGANKMGTRVWETLEQPQQVAAVCSRLLEQFDVDTETCHRDVLAFLERLSENQLVESSEQRAAGGNSRE